MEVNNIFHQSMAPVARKEYFYQWPYTAFGDGFEDVLILGAGSGTDVAASLLHGAKHIDAVEIDPVIVRLGRAAPSRSPYDDPARQRHHRRRAALPPHDAEEVQPRRVRADRLADAAIELHVGAARELHVHRGVVPRRPAIGSSRAACWSIYNYFRERWLVDRLANTAATAFGSEPRVHIHKEHSYLGVLMVGPGLAGCPRGPPVPDRVEAYNHPTWSAPACR